MIKKTTLSILMASMLVTACAGNNIKQKENNTEKQKSAKSIEITKYSEIVLSDFPVEQTQVESISNNTPGSLHSKQPLIKVVNFKFDAFELTNSNMVLIKQHAKFLISNPEYVLSINGHSDYRGPEVYNEKLSLRRANTVAALLKTYGAPDSQIIINSFGASQPVEDYDNWFQNRRVEFEYSELYIVSK